MKINTRSRIRPNRIVYLLCFFGIFVNLLYRVLENRETGDIEFEMGQTLIHVDGHWVEWYNPIFWPFFVVLAFLIYRGPVHFKYDTDGDVMNLKVKDSFLFFLGRWANKSYEFPKRKLLEWKLLRLPFFRMLTIVIESKGGEPKVRRMAISYLNDREMNRLKMSLARASKIRSPHQQASEGNPPT